MGVVKIYIEGTGFCMLVSQARTHNFSPGFYLFFIFQVQPYNRKYRSIGHRVWSMSLNILTEMSVNSASAEPSAQSVIVMHLT